MFYSWRQMYSCTRELWSFLLRDSAVAQIRGEPAWRGDAGRQEVIEAIMKLGGWGFQEPHAGAGTPLSSGVWRPSDVLWCSSLGYEKTRGEISGKKDSDTWTWQNEAWVCRAAGFRAENWTILTPFLLQTLVLIKPCPFSHGCVWKNIIRKSGHTTNEQTTSK